MSVLGTETFKAYVSGDLFGANLLFDRDRLGGAGTFDDVAKAANVTNVRWPGGTIAEKYLDLRDPDRTTCVDPDTGKTVSLLPLSEFLDWAGNNGHGAGIVIPTASLLKGALGAQTPHSDAYAIVHRFVTDLLTGKYGDADIRYLEIGNEYWLGGEQNHVEYTAIADVVARASQDAIDSLRASGKVPGGWQEPDISVQVGQYGKYATSPGHEQDNYIRDNLSDAAADAIDGVVMHYYTRGTFEDLESFEYYFDRMQGWSGDARFRGIEFHVTEWNTDHLLSKETGLGQVSTMAWMISEMVAEGVRDAFVWPLQQNTKNDLGGNEGETALTPAGEAFSLMAELLPGTTLTQRAELSGGMSYTYAGQGEHIVVASATGSAQTRVEIDPGDLGYASAEITVHLIDATGDRLGARAASKISEQTFSITDRYILKLSDHQSAVVEIDGTPGGSGQAASGSSSSKITSGTSGADTFAPTAKAGSFAGHFDGGAGSDALDLPGTIQSYDFYAHGDTIVIRDAGRADEHADGRMIATAKNIEMIEGSAVSGLSIGDGFSARATVCDVSAPSSLGSIRDYDGHDLGSSGSWRMLGMADVQFDGDAEFLYVNTALGRWATVGQNDAGRVDFNDHGAGGETRVVGIYIDPLVQSGSVARGSAHDSQTRFAKDLESGNLELAEAFDFDADGQQEIYFRLEDGSAYLRALMHTDGNIDYANYQSAAQVENYLEGLGYEPSVIDAILY